MKPTRKRPIHARITRLREAKGWTKAEFARRCGVDKTAVSHWEDGTAAPRWTLGVKVARLLGVTADELYSLTSDDSARAA